MARDNSIHQEKPIHKHCPAPLHLNLWVKLLRGVPPETTIEKTNCWNCQFKILNRHQEEKLFVMLQRPPFDLIIKVFNWKVPYRGRSWQMQTTAEKMNEWMKIYVWERGGARRAARTHTEELLQAALLRPRTEAAAFTHTHTYTHRERKPSLGLIKRSLRRHYIRAIYSSLFLFLFHLLCCNLRNKK